MILALVPEPDLIMWHEAASRLKSRDMIQVKPLGYQGSLFDEADVFFADVHGGLPGALPDRAFSGRFWATLGDLRSRMIFPVPAMFVSFDSFSVPFDTERFGGQSISHLQIHGSCTAGVKVPDLRATTGPGAHSEDPNHFVIWPTELFEGLGIRVSRDESSVVRAAYNATHGGGPLWVKPGLPFLIPDRPLSFRGLNGESVSGMLCTSVSHAGGWVVLERQDILKLLGHSGDIAWTDLHSIIGLQPAVALLGWLCAAFAGLPSRSATAG